MANSFYSITVPQSENGYLSRMIDECWDKLQDQSISLDELSAFREALRHFSDVDTSAELEAIQDEESRLKESVELAANAETRSILYDELKALEDARAQVDPSDIQSEAECSDESP
jgi:hypothetical protein